MRRAPDWLLRASLDTHGTLRPSQPVAVPSGAYGEAARGRGAAGREPCLAARGPTTAQVARGREGLWANCDQRDLHGERLLGPDDQWWVRPPRPEAASRSSPRRDP